MRYYKNFVWFTEIEKADLKAPERTLRFQITWSSGEFTTRCETPVIAKPGEFLLILGQSGVGKTSILETISGLRNFGTLSGSLVFEDKYGNIIDGMAAPFERQKNICLLQQDENHDYYKEFTVREVLNFFCLLRSRHADSVND